MKQVLILLFLLWSIFCITISPISLEKIQKDEIKVYVKGAIDKEGEYTLPLYSSMNDVLGIISVKDTADLDGINPSTILKDGDVINIPYQQDNMIKVSINYGSLEELCTLKGIGESTAQRIIDYRNEYGLFQSLEDLKKVKGIGDSKYEKIVDQICL